MKKTDLQELLTGWVIEHIILTKISNFGSVDNEDKWPFFVFPNQILHKLQIFEEKLKTQKNMTFY